MEKGQEIFFETCPIAAVDRSWIVEIVVGSTLKTNEMQIDCKNCIKFMVGWMDVEQAI